MLSQCRKCSIVRSGLASQTPSTLAGKTQKARLTDTCTRGLPAWPVPAGDGLGPFITQGKPTNRWSLRSGMLDLAVAIQGESTLGMDTTASQFPLENSYNLNTVIRSTQICNVDWYQFKLLPHEVPFITKCSTLPPEAGGATYTKCVVGP